MNLSLSVLMATVILMLNTALMRSETNQPMPEDVQALLSPWTGALGGVPPFHLVEPSLFTPAFEIAQQEMLKEVEAIADQDNQPDFDNTIKALEGVGQALDRVSTLFSVMTSNRNTEVYQALSSEIRPLLSRVYDQIYFNTKLFKRIAEVHARRAELGLLPEQSRLVEKTFESFVRRGAKLDKDEKEKMGAINQSLARLYTTFSNRVQADEDSSVSLKESDLDGLPDTLISSYKAAAENRGLEGYAVVNTRSAVDPFLTFSNRRDLREKVWRAFVSRGDHGDENDTNALIKEIVQLRAERAALLGYASHAHWRMSDTMAKDPSRAQDLLMQVWGPAVKRVKEEVADMQALADAEGSGLVIEPWDYRYYMEKVRKQRFALDQSEFKPHFELNNMIEASYEMARRLYGFAFKEITGEVPVFHPDVRVYHVTKVADGAHVGLLYRDDFARQFKKSGAWQATYQRQHQLNDKVHAIVSNNNNFTQSAEGEPVLISLDDAETLFHEFGHALHALCNDTTYPSMGGTPRDFVEFPSQVHENWVLTCDILDRFARHVETGETMSPSLIDKIRSAATFNQGFATVEYLACAILDLKIHTDPSGKIDPKALEETALAEIGMPREIVMRHRLPHFLHLFSSDAYSAGYYSYLWSDVMAADAWQAFEETGDPWHPEIARKFKEIILATGDAFDRLEAFRRFRGRDPQVEALLKNRGL